MDVFSMALMQAGWQQLLAQCRLEPAAHPLTIKQIGQWR